MRAVYTLEIEELEDDPKFNSSGICYRATIYESGEELGDGYALTSQLAVIEALKQSGVAE
jgi:hypothetical protein